MTLRFVRLAAAATTVLLALGATAWHAPAVAEVDDPELSQTIEPDQNVAQDDAVLETGHVDVGPRFQDGTWTLMAHDDTVVEGSAWRHLERTVLRVLDTAELTVPEDDAYAFLGVDPGAQVHVVPQTQNESAVWLGWNTQDPDVMSRIDRGVTLTLDGVTGPGELVVYLQAGGFGAPDVLWDSREAAGQDIWVDVNTHTHANWVFTEPGVYLVEVTASADLVDGSTVSDTQALRFAIGTATDPAEALAAEPEIDQDTTDADESATSEPSSSDDDTSTLAWWIGGAVLLVVVLAGVVVIALVRGRRAKRRAMANGETR